MPADMNIVLRKTSTLEVKQNGIIKTLQGYYTQVSSWQVVVVFWLNCTKLVQTHNFTRILETWQWSNVDKLEAKIFVVFIDLFFSGVINLCQGVQKF